MSDVYDVIYAPVVTEKSAQAIESENVYTFIVARTANKIEILRAVESIWDVKVSDVRTMRYNGKAKRALMGRPTFLDLVVINQLVGWANPLIYWMMSSVRRTLANCMAN